jgi:hypothetical protein
MGDETRILLGDDGWWRRFDDEDHGKLTSAAHELSDETARILEYLALLCGTLVHDSGWDEDAVRMLIAGIRERVYYCPDIITGPVNSLLLTGYRGSNDVNGA